MANTTFKQQMKVALVLDEDELRALHALARSITPTVRVEATVKDGMVHELKKVDDLFKLPNSAEEAIVQLVWVGHDLKSDRSTYISISSEDSIPNVSFSFEAPDTDQVRETARKMRSWLHENRAAYGWIAERDWSATIKGAWVTLFFGLWLWAQMMVPSPTKEKAPVTPAAAFIFTAFIAFPFVAGWVLRR